MSPTKYYGILITLICLKQPRGSSDLEWNEIAKEDDDAFDGVYHVEAVLGKATILPCDTDSKDRQKTIYMVLWFRQFDRKPMYGFDARGRSPGKELHWSDTERLGPRAHFITTSQPTGLQLQNVQLDDEGVYRCRVDYLNAPTKNFEIYLTVAVPPHQMIVYDHSGREIQSSVGPLHENTDLSLICEVRGGKPAPNVTWSRDGKTLENQVLVHDTNIVISRLELKNLTRQNPDATFTCTAFNTKLMTPMQKVITLKLYLKPLRVNIIPKYRELKANQIYPITCETFGSKPTVNISWWIDNTMILNNTTDDDTMTRVIHYKFKPEENNSSLKCKVTNPKIKDFEMEDSFLLNVRYPPFVSLQLGNILDSNYIKENDDVYFECRNRANPPPSKFIWYHNDRRIYQNISNGIILSGESLVLQKITKYSAGLYRCQVVNEEGESTSDPVLLRVKYSPVCQNGEAAIVGTSLGEIVNVACSVEADPAVTHFKWVLNNSVQSLVVPPEKYGIVNATTSVLGYKLISNRDFGTLTCRTTNAIGEQIKPCTFFVVKAVQPSSMTNCSFQLVDEETRPLLNVRCQPGYNGGIRQTFHLEIGNENQTMVVVNVTEIPYFRVELWKLLSVWQSGNLRFTLYSSNAKGRSESVVYEKNFVADWRSKFAEGFVLSKENKRFKDIISLIMIGSFAVILATFSLIIILVKRWYSVRKPIGCDREIKSTMTKVRGDPNEEQYLISYQFSDEKPDILNRVMESCRMDSETPSPVRHSSKEGIAQNDPPNGRPNSKYLLLVKTAESQVAQHAVTCKKLQTTSDTFLGPESSV